MSKQDAAHRIPILSVALVHCQIGQVTSCCPGLPRPEAKQPLCPLLTPLTQNSDLWIRVMRAHPLQPPFFWGRVGEKALTL